MKAVCIVIASLAVVGCSDEGSAVDAGAPDAGGERACPVDIATYCASQSCPSSPADAVTQLCASRPEVGICGNSVTTWAIDVGTTYDFDDAGRLTTIVYDTNGNLSCIAGPADASLAACGTTVSVCPQDAGAD